MDVFPPNADANEICDPILENVAVIVGATRGRQQAQAIILKGFGPVDIFCIPLFARPLQEIFIILFEARELDHALRNLNWQRQSSTTNFQNGIFKARSHV